MRHQQSVCALTYCMCVHCLTETRIENVLIFTNYTLKYADCMQSELRAALCERQAEVQQAVYRRGGEEKESWLCL